MSKIVTYQQANRLVALGYNIVLHCSCHEYECIGCKSVNLSSAKKISVSEALDWVREKKWIACGVHPYAIYEDIPDGDQHFLKWGYKYVAFQGLSEWQNMDKEVFDTHPLAENE